MHLQLILTIQVLTTADLHFAESGVTLKNAPENFIEVFVGFQLGRKLCVRAHMRRSKQGRVWFKVYSTDTSKNLPTHRNQIESRTPSA